MKVIERTFSPARQEVGTVPAGIVIKFLDKGPMDISIVSPYIVCKVPPHCHPDGYACNYKVPVVQLRSGLLSYVECYQKVHTFDSAELHMERTP